MRLRIPDRIQRIAAYAPIEPYEVLSKRLGYTPDQIVKLDANENPYGMSPIAREALSRLSFPHVYPDPESRALREALAQFTGVRVENLIAGSGADELIDLILRAVLDPGDQVLICPPTFGMYAFDTQINTGQVIEVPRMANFQLSLENIRHVVEARQPKVLFLASPNNPDGSLPSRQELAALLQLPVLVVVDEAYIEFTAEGGRLGEDLSLIKEVEVRENLVVLRTFSKWAGLAGLRVGYGAFPIWLADVLWKIKQPYNVNVAGTQAAIASLNDLGWLADNVAKIRLERSRLSQALRQIPYLQPFPSQTNFILCKINGRPAFDLKNKLASQGILVRHYHTTGLDNYIRISVGRPEDTARLIAALEAEI